MLPKTIPCDMLCGHGAVWRVLNRASNNEYALCRECSGRVIRTCTERMHILGPVQSEEALNDWLRDRAKECAEELFEGRSALNAWDMLLTGKVEIPPDVEEAMNALELQREAA